MNVHLTPESEQLLKQQLTHGTFRSPEEVIERALEVLAEKHPTNEERQNDLAAKAIADIFELRQGITLGGPKVRDLIHEGHRI